MRSKIKLIICIIFVLIISGLLFFCRSKYKKIELAKEPDGIFSSQYTNKLAVIIDGKLTMYDETGRSRYIDTPFDISLAYPLEDSIYLVDKEGNLYELNYKLYTETPISDIILTNVKYFSCAHNSNDNTVCCGAITENGELYVWGSNKGYCLGIDGPENIEIPTKIENIKDAKKIQFASETTMVLTETGYVYEAGCVSSESDGEDVIYNYQKEFVKLEELSDVTDINTGYSKIIMWDDKIEYWNSYGYDVREEHRFDITYGDTLFKCYSQSSLFCVTLDEEGKVYCLGYDFARVEHVNCKCITHFFEPQIITKIKNAEEVYAASSVAYVKAGNEIVVLKDKRR
ncbi:MAG: hypothetical protein E7259_02985 [Lachnospiraceae bacterium]|nr:hypothetical protein [Lachnospiraceae bacterium]